MTDWISKDPPTVSEADNNNTEDQEEEENPNIISSRLYLRPIPNSQPLDKETALRRIRHRKRMIKVRNAVQGLFRWQDSVKNDKVSVCNQTKWVDDAFSAP